MRKPTEIQLMLDGQDFLKQFVSDLRKDVKALGGDDVMTYNALKSASNLRKEFAKIIVGVANAAKTALKNFFTSNGSISFFFEDNFKNWLLSKEFGYVKRKGDVLKHNLPRNMADKEILTEFKIRSYGSISEVLSEIRDLISNQSNGEKGDLLTNDYWNIFYVKLEDDETVAVYAHWHSGGRYWCLHARRLGDGRWDEGNRVFSRS